MSDKLSTPEETIKALEELMESVSGVTNYANVHNSTALKVKVKKLHDHATIPTYAKFGDVGMDFTATSKLTENDRIIYGTDLAFEIPEGYFMMLVPRSSIYKKDLYLTNHCGIIDSGYRGEVKFIFRKDPKPEVFGSFFSPIDSYNIGDRIGQAIILPYPKVEFEEVNELSDSERGSGGFGSSGI